MREQKDYPKTVHRRLGSRMTALIVSMLMLMSCFGQLSVSAADTIGSISLGAYLMDDTKICEFDGTSTGTVATGSTFRVQATTGFSSVDAKDHTIRLYVGNMTNSSFTTLSTTGETTIGGITYKMGTCNDDEAHNGETYVEVTSITVTGDTFIINLPAQFNKTAPNGSEWTIVLSIDRQDKAEITLTAQSDASMSNTKQLGTGQSSSVVLSNGDGVEEELQSITYSVSAYEGQYIDSTATELNGGVSAISEYTVTDTITLPEGLYFSVNASDDTGIKAELAQKIVVNGFGGVVISSFSTVSSGRVNSITFTYTETNADTSKQIKDLSGTVTYSGITAGTDFTGSGTITNRFSTKYKLVGHGGEKLVEAVTVNIDVRRPTESGVSDLTKSIDDVADKNGNYNLFASNPYVLWGDYVIYKISFTNKGEQSLNNVSFSDTLPTGMTPLSDEDKDELNSLKGYFTSTSYQNKLDWESAWSDNSGVTVSLNGNTVTFSDISLGGGDEFNGYIVAKVEAIEGTETTRTLTNTVTVEGQNASVSVLQKRLEADLAITKMAYKNGNITNEYVPGQPVEYQITVTNKGTAAAENVTLDDYFPAGWLKMDSVTSGGTNVEIQSPADTNIDEYKKYTWNLGSIAAGASVTYIIQCSANNDASGTVLNTARCTCGDKTAEDWWPLSQGEDLTPAQKVEISKVRTSNYLYVKHGDQVTYRITFTAPDGFTDDSPLVMTDVLPAWLQFNSYSFSTSDNSTSGRNLTQQYDDNTLTFSFTGTLGNNSGYIDITCTVLDTAIEGDRHENAVQVVGGSSAKAAEIIVGDGTVTHDNMQISKTGYVMRNNEKVELSTVGNVIDVGETVYFEIKITNIGAENITELTVKDQLEGIYNGSVASSTVSVAGIDAYGTFTANYTGDYSASGFIPTQPSEWTFSTKDNYYPNNFGRSNFKIAPKETMTLSYSVQTSDGFTSGSNGAAVNDSDYSSVAYNAMPTLSITKTDDQGSEVVYTGDGDSLESKEIGYTVTVANTSNAPYTTSGAYIVDELPDGMTISRIGEVAINGTVQHAKFYGGNTYTDPNWTELSETVTEEYKYLGIQPAGGVITIPANSSMIITYYTKLNSTMLSDLNSQIESGGSFAPERLTNTVVFIGEKQFLSTAGTAVKQIRANNTVELRSKTAQPKIEKTAYAYMDTNSDSISDGQYANAGSYLIWKIKLTNDCNDNDGASMTSYEIIDTLPDNYEYVSGNIYTNDKGVKFPDDLTDQNFKTGSMILTNDGEVSKKEFLDPTIDGKTVTWSFSGDYTLDPGDSIEFVFITKPVANNFGIFTNTAQVKVNGVIYEDEDSLILSSGDTFSINTVKTSSEKTAELKSDGKIYYTLTVNNESSSSELSNFTIIDRLPYVGDTGVLANEKRYSECDVIYDTNDLKVYVDGTELDSDKYSVTYSGESNVIFNADDGDWDGINDRVTWTDTAVSSTKLIRIRVLENIPTKAKVEVKFSVTPNPSNIELESKVYNTFGYCYDSASVYNMAAEAPKTETVISGEYTEKGVITVNKQYIDSSAGRRTFYFAVYNEEYTDGAQPVDGIKSLTLTGVTSGGAATASVQFNVDIPDLGYVTKYYVYETNENGVPITQTSELGYRMYCGETETQDNNMCYDVSEITTTNVTDTVTFKNMVPTPGVTVSGPYVANVPVDYSFVTEWDKDHVSGHYDEKGEFVTVDDNNGEDRIEKTMIFGEAMSEHSDGWGHDQGHTIATGFFATVNGVGTTINTASWSVFSDSKADGETFMKLSAEEVQTLENNGYTVTAVEGNEGIYEVSGKQVKMSFKVNLPTITLSAGSKAYIGLIIDSIYDKGATAEMAVNETVTSAENNVAQNAMSEANNAPGILNNSPNKTTESFTSQTQE